MYTAQPFIRIIDYKYKTNYYVPFAIPDDYDVETQGRTWANWHVDEAGIQKICNLFNHSAGYVNDNPKLKASDLCVKLWEEWILAFLEELEKTDVTNPHFQGFPWGHNWYQFTISAPTNLAYYIVNKKNSRAINSAAAKAIQYLIIDPEHSLGYTRDKANSAMMLFPWTLSHLITGTLDTSNVSYLYAIEQYNLAPNKTIAANMDGVHIDGSYLTHNGVYAFGYLDSIYEIYPDTKQVIPEVAKYKLEVHIDRIHALLFHKTIARSGSTLWHRRQDTRCATYSGHLKTDKCEVMPLMRYVRVFNDEPGYEYQWSLRLPQRTIAFYESDQNVNDMGLYSCMCVKPFYPTDDDLPNFPVSGFYYRNGQTGLTTVENTNTTTTPHYASPMQKEAFAAVFRFKNEWVFAFSQYMSLFPLIEKFHINQLYFFTIQKDTLDYYAGYGHEENYARNHYTFTWGGENYKINDYGTYVHGLMNLKTKTHTFEEWTLPTKNVDVESDAINRSTAHIPSLDWLTDGKFDSKNYGEQSSIYTVFYRIDNSTYVPIGLCPSETEVCGDTLNMYDPVNKNKVTFTFDMKTNQYITDEYYK